MSDNVFDPIMLPNLVEGVASGYISMANSTTTPLEAAATYTGTWENASEYASLSILVSCDVNGTLYLDSSTDGSNVDRSLQFSSGADTMSTIHTAIIISKYIRIRVVNGASPQSYLRLQTIFNTGARIAVPTSRLSNSIGKYSDVIPVKIAGSQELDLVTGLQAGRSLTHVFGTASAVSTTEVVVSSVDTTYTGFLTAATTVRIRTGGNANDTAAGTGARTILVEGLDGDFNPVSETLTTAGASASASTTATFIRIKKISVTSSGTYSAGVDGGNVGIIILETTGGVLLATMRAGIGSNACSCFTVPAGYTAYLSSWDVTVDTTRAATVRLFSRENADDVAAAFSPRKAVMSLLSVTGNFSKEYPYPNPAFPAKTDVWVTAFTSTGTTAVSTEMDFILISNT